MIFNKKGQTSVETAVILGIMLFILLIFLVANFEMNNSFRSKYSDEKIKLSLNKIARGAERVYYQGNGSKTEEIISLPSNIYNSSLDGNTITFNVFPSGDIDGFIPVYTILDFNVSGNLPNKSGKYLIEIESFEGYVNVSYE
ncbi:MAG: hypothetical protein ACQER9_02065 [Nanobdellota archaeon]